MKVNGGRPQSPSPMPSDTAKAGTSAKIGAGDGIVESKKAKAAGIDAAGSSRVDVSSRAQEMMKAKELATPSDDVDDAKVARLQKMIDEGKYRVDADAIADRLLEEHSKMPL